MCGKITSNCKSMGHTYTTQDPLHFILLQVCMPWIILACVMVTIICIIDLDRAPRRIRDVLHTLTKLRLLVTYVKVLWLWSTAFLFWFIAFKYDSSAVMAFFTSYGSSIYVLDVSAALAGF
jgi:hypothetical protein